MGDGSPASVLVRSEVFGGAADEGEMPEVSLEALDEELPLRELIRRVVEEQVRELLANKRSEARDEASAPEEVRRILERRYMTPEEISQYGREGAVRLPAERERGEPEIDLNAEVRQAIRAFEAGGYCVFVGDRQVESLEERVRFAPGTRVVFLRVMPLVGG